MASLSCCFGWRPILMTTALLVACPVAAADAICGVAKAPVAQLESNIRKQGWTTMSEAGAEFRVYYSPDASGRTLMFPRSGAIGYPSAVCRVANFEGTGWEVSKICEASSSGCKELDAFIKQYLK